MHFGLAAARASLFEMVLVSILLAIKKGKGEITTPEEFEQFQEQLQKKTTFGILIKDVKAVVPITPDAETVVTEALNRRNFLMHHFFRDRAFAFSTAEGRKQLI